MPQVSPSTPPVTCDGSTHNTHLKPEELMRKKFIFVTGGVLSSLGKGLSGAAMGALLEARGSSHQPQVDPYINVDPAP